MTSKRISTLDPRGLLATLQVACVLVLGGGLSAPTAEAGGDWLVLKEETATRISSDPSVGINDVQEKDLATGDVDQDGDTDLIIVRKLPFTNEGGFRNVLFMNEGGVMTDRTDTLAPHFLDLTDDRDVELADVDGDGWLDIITAGTFHEQPRILMNLGEDKGGLWLGFSYDASRLPHLETPQGNGPFFCGLGVGDVTGNGRPDLYFADYGGQAGLPESADMEDRLLINDGFGFFTDETAARLAPEMVDSTFGTDADIADMNGDGFHDIIKNNSSGSGAPDSVLGETPAVAILYNDGTGNFTFMDNVYTISPYMVEPADFTQDGRLDLIVVDDGQDRYMTNTGNDVSGHAQFTTTAVSGPNTQFFGGNLEIADLDGDGVLDVMIADVDTDLPGCSRQLVILEGQGTPPNISYGDPLAGASRPWTPQGVHDIKAFHINDDEKLDLWMSTCTGTLIFMGVVPEIFGDGFEDGSTSAWTVTVP